MKLLRMTSLVMAVLMYLSLCACGSSEAPAEQPAAAETAAPVEEAPVVDTPAEDPAEDPANELKEIAASYVGREVAELFDAIGTPVESSYAPSCLGDGEDGEHHYDGFIVYTYKEGESEIIQVVL